MRQSRRLERELLAAAVGAALGVAALVTVFLSSGGIEDVLHALVRARDARMDARGDRRDASRLPPCWRCIRERLAHGRVSWWHAVRTDLLLFGLGNVLPGAPAPGAVLAAAELRRAGLSVRGARFVIAFTAWFNVRTLLGIGAVTFLVAFARERPGLKEAGMWWLAAVGLLMTARRDREDGRETGDRRARTARFLARVRIGRVSVRLQDTRAAADGWHAEAKAVVGSRANRVVLVSLAAGSWLADAACLRLSLAAAGSTSTWTSCYSPTSRDPRVGRAVAARRVRRGRGGDPRRAPPLRGPA